MKTTYTIGTFIFYDKMLASGEIVRKVGREENYLGGWIWRYKEDAKTFIDTDNIIIDGTKRDNKKFAVYQLELSGNWDTDVSKELDEYGVNMLLVDAIILRKII